jgi:hypothetical protein
MLRYFYFYKIEIAFKLKMRILLTCVQSIAINIKWHFMLQLKYVLLHIKKYMQIAKL